MVKSHVVLDNLSIVYFDFISLSLDDEVLSGNISLSHYLSLNSKSRNISSVWKVGNKSDGEGQVLALSDHETFRFTEFDNTSVSLIDRDIKINLTVNSIHMVELEDQLLDLIRDILILKRNREDSLVQTEDTRVDEGLMKPELGLVGFILEERWLCCGSMDLFWWLTSCWINK